MTFNEERIKGLFIKSIFVPNSRNTFDLPNSNGGFVSIIKWSDKKFIVFKWHEPQVPSSDHKIVIFDAKILDKRPANDYLRSVISETNEATRPAAAKSLPTTKPKGE